MSSRKPVLIAVLATAGVLLAGGGATVWALWPDEPAPAAVPVATVTAAPTRIALDSRARTACELLDKAARTRASSTGPLTDVEASLDEFDAHTAALGSTVTELQTIALSDEDNGGPYTADQVEEQIRTWCAANWTPGS